jgi:hypothetical protein
MAVTVHVLAQPSQRVLRPARDFRGTKSAERDVERNRQTWRDALRDDECAFVAVVLDEDGLPLKAWEYPRVGWGDDGIETGRETLRAMKAQAAE